jgi:RNA polymerase sigma-70 factor (ECF subfamily)
LFADGTWCEPAKFYWDFLLPGTGIKKLPACNNSAGQFVVHDENVIRELEFKVLCQRHSSEIYRFAYSLLGNRADAEDATQEVLLRLWNHLPKMYIFNLKAWLMQTTRCYCLDQIRRRSNQTAPVYMDDELLNDQPDDTAVNPSQAADANLRLKQAHQMLVKLPENLRSVFVLYEVNGLRYREIAEVLGIPINSVKVHLLRAREKISKLVNEEKPCDRI